MHPQKRPLSVTVVACAYILVGVIGFFAHLRPLTAADAFRFDGVPLELIELAALVCGVFLLLAHNWARWAAVAWMSFHVVVSAFNAVFEFAVHLVLCGIIAWALFRPVSARYFQR
jgi:hypothetical protein